jgi:hypothetical protein
MVKPGSWVYPVAFASQPTVTELPYLSASPDLPT